jgi:uncharacterized membrane protein
MPPGAPSQRDRPQSQSMSTTTTITAWRASPSYRGYRFARESGSADGGIPWSVEWDLRRNSSLAQRQMLWVLAALGMLALGIAAVFWQQGAPLVLPFAGIELLALAVAMGVHLRHARDREHIALRDDGLTVEHACGRRVERVEFQPLWVRVEPRHGDRSLIELSGQGRRIAVGRFVRPELRQQLADELRRALRRWQQRAGRAQPVREATDSTTD